MRFIRSTLIQQGLSKRATSVIMKSWRSRTRKQYNVYLTRFLKYCKSRGKNPLDKCAQTTVEFLSDLFHSGYGYSAINTARSAISAINGVGSDNLVCRFLKGVFNIKPSRPRYTSIWDISLVLDYLRLCSPAKELSLFMLGAKLLTLCAIVTGHRCQTFHAMTIDKSNMTLSMNKAVFRIDSLLKHNAPSHSLSVVTLHSFHEDRRICVLTCLKEYLNRTRGLRISNKLFISTQSPHSGVSKDTLSRWIRLILTKSGIDTNIFKAHSTRSASCSSAVRNIDVWHVLRTAEWKRESTFARFYKKPTESSSESFANAVLSSKATQL